MGIEWREVARYSDYEVSNTGLLRRKGSKRIIQQTRVSIFGATEYVGRLVAEAFLPNPDSLSDVHHINGNKEDNRVENLRWASHSETQTISFGGYGRNAPGGAEESKSIRIVETGEIFPSIKSCARAIDGSPSAIRRCLRGEYSHHKGYTFELLN